MPKIGMNSDLNNMKKNGSTIGMHCKVHTSPIGQSGWIQEETMTTSTSNPSTLRSTTSVTIPCRALVIPAPTYTISNYPTEKLPPLSLSMRALTLARGARSISSACWTVLSWNMWRELPGAM
uniref:Uncharacterized protein n=1 Tax=Cacopsylla melanoneura TaxID=428564 RepID=A0A8D8S6Y0_9HEMI